MDLIQSVQTYLKVLLDLIDKMLRKLKNVRVLMMIYLVELIVSTMY